MTRGQKWFVLLAMVAGCIIGPIIAQQQYSGGMAVTVSSGSITATQGTGTNLHTVVDSGSMTVTQGTGTNLHAVIDSASGVTLNALPAGTNKVGIAYPYTSCGTTAVTQALTALPTTATAVTGTTSCLVNLYLHNTSSSTAYTVTVTDGQGTPVPFINAATLNPLETREYNFPAGGPKMTTGLKWSASNVAVTGAVEMLQ